MPIKPNREYRMAMPFSALENGYIVEGYATVFDQPYEFGFDGMSEVISRSAFDTADMSDIIFQLNHEGPVMARQRNKTLEVHPDEHGLYTKADLGGSQAGRDLYEAIKNGLIDRMSWGFIVAEDGWDYDPATRTATLTKLAKVFDVSAVSMPACDATVIHARSYLDGVIEAEQQELLLRDKEARERELLRLRLIRL